MKVQYLAPALVAISLAACQPGGKKATTDSIQVAAVTEAPATPEGYYEASLAAASTPGRLIALTLRSTNDAQMTTDYLNSTPEVVQMGNWAAIDSTQLQITLVTVGSGNPQKDTLNFKRDGHNLVYLGDYYGSAGLTLVKKDAAPAPASKELVVWVQNEDECDLGPGFGKTKCYDVQYGDKLMSTTPRDWDKLMEPIEGFVYEKGNRYKLKVKRSPRDPQVQDVGAYTYKLLEVLSKEKAK